MFWDREVAPLAETGTQAPPGARVARWRREPRLSRGYAYLAGRPLPGPVFPPPTGILRSGNPGGPHESRHRSARGRAGRAVVAGRGAARPAGGARLRLAHLRRAAPGIPGPGEPR